MSRRCRRQPVPRHHASRRPGRGPCCRRPSPARGPARSSSPPRSARPRRCPRDATGLAAQLGPVTVTLTILDRTGAAYQIAAGTLAADGRPHLLVASLGGEQARYPLRVAAITATFLLPLRAWSGTRPHPERPAAGRLDPAGKLARPDQTCRQVQSRSQRRANAAHETGRDVHLCPRLRGHTPGGRSPGRRRQRRSPGSCCYSPGLPR